MSDFTEANVCRDCAHACSIQPQAGFGTVIRLHDISNYLYSSNGEAARVDGSMRVTKAKGRRLERGDRGKVDDTAYFVGSGNVYEDLDSADAEERLAKLKLAAQINEIIAEKGWTQKMAAQKLGTQQPEISNLSRGRLRSITYDRLVDWLVALGYSVEIKVKRSKNPHVEVAIAV